ncbi:MAG TPA: type II toxin-antitoxin system prevent-host-death family antitoxin [Planktothrix sp.]|jgi:prevent-host-death family protein
MSAAGRKVDVSELKQGLDHYLDNAVVGPLIVERTGQNPVVLLSIEEFDRLSAFEDAYWAHQATEAQKSGWASEKEVAALLEKFSRREIGD